MVMPEYHASKKGVRGGVNKQGTGWL